MFTHLKILGFELTFFHKFLLAMKSIYTATLDRVLVTVLLCFCLIIVISFLQQKMKVTYVGVELFDMNSGDLRWCLDFRDMSTPSIVILANGSFVLCPLYGRKSKAFQAASGTSNSAIVSNLVILIFNLHCLTMTFSFKAIIVVTYMLH